MDPVRFSFSRQPLTFDVRLATAPVAMSKGVVSPGIVDDRPRSAPMSWITTMTDRVNALWDAFYGRRQVAALTETMTDKDLDVEKGIQREERPSASKLPMADNN